MAVLRICRCGDDIDPRRWQLGMRACAKCGEQKAQAEIKAKANRVAPYANKGGYMLVTGNSLAEIKENLQAGNKVPGRDEPSQHTTYGGAYRPKPVEVAAPKPVRLLRVILHKGVRYPVMLMSDGTKSCPLKGWQKFQ